MRSLETELEERKQLEGVLRSALHRRAMVAGALEEQSAQEAERFGRPGGVVEEARLADPGLALDQHDPPPAAGNVFERGLENRLLAATSEW